MHTSPDMKYVAFIELQISINYQIERVALWVALIGILPSFQLVFKLVYMWLNTDLIHFQ